MSIAPGRLDDARMPYYGQHRAIPDYRDSLPPAPPLSETIAELEKLAGYDRADTNEWRRNRDWEREMHRLGMGDRIKREPRPEPLPPESYAALLEGLEARHAEKLAELQASIPAQPILTLRERSHQQRMAEWLEPFPIAIRWGLTRQHQQIEAKHGALRADWYITVFHELHSSPLVDWRANDGDIRDLAGHHASAIAKLVPPLLGKVPRAVKCLRTRMLVGHQTLRQRERTAYAAVRAYVDALGLTAPKKPRGKQSYGGLLTRLSGTGWWKRQLTKWHDQGIEAIERALGLIHNHAAYAVSNTGNMQARYRRERTAKLLAEMDAISDEGEVIALAKLIEKGPANAYIRFVELMTRVKGMSRLADRFGYEGLFLTWTLESRFHSHYEKTGARNAKWQGETVNDGRAELQQQWAQARAMFSKEKLRVFGQRGAEPHHDGCPHWHLLLFVHPADRERVLAICRQKAEEGAPQEITDQNPDVRFKVVNIERDANGALKAASYIAKYLTKNIAGAHLGTFIARSQTGDLFGKTAFEPAAGDNDQGTGVEAMVARVRAWASRWRIRQFQVFGFLPIGTWRELRRMGSTVHEDPVIEAGRAAADAGDFMACALAAGAWDFTRNAPAPRKQLRLRLYRQRDERRNRYGEERPDEVKGVAHVDVGEIEAKRLADEARLTARELEAFENEGGRCIPLPTSKRRRLAGCRRKPTKLAARQIASPLLAFAITRRVRWTIARRAVAGPWTRVTNCNHHGEAHGPETGPPTPAARPDPRPPHRT